MAIMLSAFFNGLEPQVSAIELGLDQYTASQAGCPDRLCEAIRYSVLAPGKRLRPLLALVACETVGGKWKNAIPVACAVEFIHAYSLIHDDLPAMDDDELRRGRLTCHRKFDEATAILAGDSLQMLAIEVICKEMPPVQAANCCRILSMAAGRCQLVGGQADDLAAEGRFGGPGQFKMTEVDFLKNIHVRKTGSLIEASLQLGGVAGGGSDQDLESLAKYGRCIGLAFQIVDDCLDIEATAEQLGKNTRKDSTHGKLTYPGLLGLDASRKLAAGLIGDALNAIAVFGQRGKKLAELASFVVERSS